MNRADLHEYEFMVKVRSPHRADEITAELLETAQNYMFAEDRRDHSPTAYVTSTVKVPHVPKIGEQYRYGNHGVQHQGVRRVIALEGTHVVLSGRPNLKLDRPVVRTFNELAAWTRVD